MIELEFYKDEKLEKTCKTPFIGWKVTRFCAGLVDKDGNFKNEVYNDDPLKLYEDLIVKLFEGQLEEDAFEKYEVEGSKVIAIGKKILESVKNKEEKN